MVQTSHETGQRMIDVDCDAHLMIDEITAESNTYGTSLKTKLSVLGCTDPSQVGKTITEFFKCDGEASGMALNLAEATGIVTRQQREEARKAGVGLSFDESLMKGRQICAKIRMKPNLRKNPVTQQNEVDPTKPGPFPRIGFDTFGVWDKKAEHIPKDMQFASMLARPAGQTAQQPQAAPQATPHQPPQPAQQALPLSGTPNPPGMAMNW